MEFDANEYRKHRAGRMGKEPYFPAGTKHEDVYVTSNGRLFVWDKPKNDANRVNHGIDFYTAMYVFNDEDRLEDDNQIVEGEVREQVIGEPVPPFLEEHPPETRHSRPKAILGLIEGVLFIVYVQEEADMGMVTRIISARPADEDEVAAYFEWKFNG